MADRDNDEKFDKGIEKQTLGGQRSDRSEYGSQADQREGGGGQPIGGNDSGTGSGTPLTQGAEFSGDAAMQSGGSEPPRSMGTRGTEFGQFGDATGPSGQQGQSGTGQADLGSQAGSTLAGRSDQQDLGIDQPGSVGGATGRQGEGFILQQGSGSDDLEQRQGATEPSSAKATGGTDFASRGRGAAEDEDDGEGHPS